MAGKPVKKITLDKYELDRGQAKPPERLTSSSLHFQVAAVAFHWRPTDANKENNQREGGVGGRFGSCVKADTRGRSDAGMEPSINFMGTGILEGAS